MTFIKVVGALIHSLSIPIRKIHLLNLTPNGYFSVSGGMAEANFC